MTTRAKVWAGSLAVALVATASFWSCRPTAASRSEPGRKSATTADGPTRSPGARIEARAAWPDAKAKTLHDTLRELEALAMMDLDAAVAWARQNGDAALAEALLDDDRHLTAPSRVVLALLEKLPRDPKAAAAMRDVLLRADAEDIRAWAIESPASEQKQTAFVQFCQLAPQRAPELLLDYACNLADGPHRRELLGMMVRAWMRSDPQAATAWLVQSCPPTAAASVWGALAAEWAGTDPELTAQLAATLPIGPAQKQAVAAAVAGWARRDPEAAADWIATLPEGSSRRAASEQLVFTWFRHDPGAVANWVASLSPGPSRDLALATYNAMIHRTTTRS